MISVGIGCGSVGECLLSMLKALGPISSMKSRNNNNNETLLPLSKSPILLVSVICDSTCFIVLNYVCT